MRAVNILRIVRTGVMVHLLRLGAPERADLLVPRVPRLSLILVRAGAVRVRAQHIFRQAAEPRADMLEQKLHLVLRQLIHMPLAPRALRALPESAEPQEGQVALELLL